MSRKVLMAAVAGCSVANYAGAMTGYTMVSLLPTRELFGVSSGSAGVYRMASAFSANTNGDVALYGYYSDGTGNFGAYPTNVESGVLATRQSNGTYVESRLNISSALSGAYKASVFYGNNVNSYQVGAAAVTNTFGTGLGAGGAANQHALATVAGTPNVYSGFTVTGLGTETASSLYGINNANIGVGYAAVGATGSRAQLYIGSSGTLTTVTTTTSDGLNVSVLRGISQSTTAHPSGLAVGTTTGSSTTISACMYDIDGDAVTKIPLPTNTGTITYTASSATGISSDGRYVACTEFAGASAPANAMNSQFPEYTGASNQRAFIYDTVLGTSTVIPYSNQGDLANTNPSAWYGQSANTSGWEVGNTNNAKTYVFDGTASFDPRAYLVNKSSDTTQISSLNYIDDNGYIYGLAFFTNPLGGAPINQPVVLIPVPEASSAALLGLGGMMLGLRRTRRA